MGPTLPDRLLSSQSDEQLVRLARAGSERAFAAIVERYRRELYAHARRMGCDGRADDLVQQTFLSAFAALRSGTEVKHLRGWLYRILRNEVIRTSSRAILEVELDPASIASEPLEEASHRRMLALETLSSIADLPARQRHALVATALDGQSRAAVAGSMGLSEGAVRQLMHRARATLRAAVAAVTPSPFANWLAAIRRAASNQGPEIAVGGGATSAAGVAAKLGAILATGAVATGIVGSQLGSRSGHLAASRVQSTNEAVVGGAGAPGRAEGTGLPDVAGLVARGIAGSAVGALEPQNGSANAGPGQTGLETPDVAGHHRNPVPERLAGSGPPRSSQATSAGSPSAGGATEPERRGSSGRDSSTGGGGGSGGAGGFEPASGGVSNGGDSAADGSGAGATSPSADGGHDGGSSDGGTLNGGAASDGGTSSTSGSSDGGSSGTSGSDGGATGTTGSSSSGG